MRPYTFVRYPHLISSLLALSVISPLTQGTARDVTVGMGVTTGYEWYERRYDDENSDTVTTDDAAGIVTTTEDLTNLDDNYSRLRVTPLINMEVLSARDSIKFRYAPGFRYDTKSYDHDIDHDFSASVDRSITENWRFTITEKFLFSDMVADGSDADSTSSETISTNNGRRQYWTNDLSLRTEYIYWEDSKISLGYTNNILEDVDDQDEESGYDNHDRHTISLVMNHRFNSIYRLGFTSAYVRGFFDEAGDFGSDEDFVNEDLKEYRLDTVLGAAVIENHPLSLSHSFLGIDYDQSTRSSNVLHDLTLDWKWQFSKDFSLGLGGGPSYEKTEGQEESWGYNANLDVVLNIEDGILQLSGDNGYDRENFSGTDENGLQEYWLARLDFSYQLLKDLSFTLYSSYRYEDQEYLSDVTVSEDGDSVESVETDVFSRQTASFGTSLRYLFQQWYELSFSYNYIYQDSEQIDDSYNEHRLVVSLGFKNDLFNW